MKALVTGGAGLIGTRLCQKLLESGYEVMVVDNLITSAKENIDPLFKNKKLSFKKLDIISSSFLREIAEDGNFDEIYHLACPTGVPNIKTLGEEMILTCSLGTKNILDLALKMNSKILFTSSSEVYGNPEIFPQNEDYHGDVDPVGFRAPYEEGKRFSEALCMLYFNKYQLPVKIVRLFNTYGRTEGRDTRIISRFIRDSARGFPIRVFGTGLQTRTFAYVDDTVEGLTLVMKKGKPGEVYNLGSDSEIKILEVARLVKKLAKSKSKIVKVKAPFPDHRGRKPDISKIRKLGWRQKISLDEGIKRTLLKKGHRI